MSLTTWRALEPFLEAMRASATVDDRVERRETRRRHRRRSWCSRRERRLPADIEETDRAEESEERRAERREDAGRRPSATMRSSRHGADPEHDRRPSSGSSVAARSNDDQEGAEGAGGDEAESRARRERMRAAPSLRASEPRITPPSARAMPEYWTASASRPSRALRRPRRSSPRPRCARRRSSSRSLARVERGEPDDAERRGGDRERHVDGFRGPSPRTSTTSAIPAARASGPRAGRRPRRSGA